MSQKAFTHPNNRKRWLLLFFVFSLLSLMVLSIAAALGWGYALWLLSGRKLIPALGFWLALGGIGWFFFRPLRQWD